MAKVKYSAYLNEVEIASQRIREAFNLYIDVIYLQLRHNEINSKTFGKGRDRAFRGLQS